MVGGGGRAGPIRSVALVLDACRGRRHIATGRSRPSSSSPAKPLTGAAHWPTGDFESNTVIPAVGFETATGSRVSAFSVGIQYGESVEKHRYGPPMRPHTSREDNGCEKQSQNEGANHVPHQPHACRDNQQRKAAESRGKPRDGVRTASAPSATMVATAIRGQRISSERPSSDRSSFREAAERGKPHVECASRQSWSSSGSWCDRRQDAGLS